MPKDKFDLLLLIQEHGLLGYLWFLILSFWAGTVRYLSSLNGRKPKFFEWLSETIISGFVGVITAMVCQYYNLDYLITAAITGVAAHNGTRSLYLLTEILKKNTSEIKFDIYNPDKPPLKKLNSKGDKDGK